MLEVDSLTAGYGETTVLRGVSLVVPPSRAVALLGPNGAGKTTFLRAVSGLLRPRAGEVKLDGQTVTGRSVDYMARAGLCHIPEGRGIFPSLTVRENLVLQSPKGQEKSSIERAAEVFPVLGGRLKQLAGSLSGGEQQMVALMRAFLCAPKVVVVDEPSTGLAPLIVDQIFAALKELVRAGTGLLVVEQYVARALDIADTAYLLNRGEIVFHSEARDLQDREVLEHYLGGAAGA